jgi:hypothetical protein
MARMGLAQQQIYLTKEQGPGLREAWHQLQDNPIARYGLLQQRRRAALAPQWRTWLAALILLLVSAGIGMPLVRIAILRLDGHGVYHLSSAPWQYFGPWLYYTILYTVAALALAYVLWLAQGIFAAVRDATLALASPRAGCATAVDELVAISALSNSEIMLGTLKLLLVPLIPRIVIGAGLPLVTISTALVLNLLHPVQQYIWINNLGGAKLLQVWDAQLYASGKLCLLGVILLLTFAAMVFHGLLGLAILLLLMIVAGRKAGNAVLATSAGALHAVAQTAPVLLAGCVTVTAFLTTGMLPGWQDRLDQLSLTLFLGIATGPIILIVLIRLLRNSAVLRYCALLLPSTGLSALLVLIASPLLRDPSWLSWIALPASCAAAGFAVLSLATVPVNQFASPVMVGLPEYSANVGFNYSFNMGWLVVLVSQAVLLLLLIVMARDAVRLYRQPGQL